MKNLNKRFLGMVHHLLVDGINFGTATKNMNRADQIEDVCRGYVEVMEEIQEKARKYDELCK